MLRTPLLPVAAIALAVGFGCTPAPATLTDADVAAINQLTADFQAAFLAGNFDAVVAMYTEDAVLMPPNAPAVRGRAAIKEFMAGFPPVTAFEIKTTHVEGVGDLAYVSGTATMTMGAAGDEMPMTDQLKYLEIRKKQADGRWLLAYDIFNSDMPAPEM